jgi:hypothetical protein
LIWSTTSWFRVEGFDAVRVKGLAALPFSTDSTKKRPLTDIVVTMGSVKYDKEAERGGKKMMVSCCVVNCGSYCIISYHISRVVPKRIKCPNKYVS